MVTVALIIAAVLVAAFAASRWLGPRAAHFGATPADVPAAKAAGAELLAAADETFLVFVAHPDDAEWWAGGTLGMLAKHNDVVLVMGTSGDAGNGGLTPGLGAIREELQLKAAKILGYADVVFLRHPDGHLAEAKEYPGEVLDLVQRYAPQGVITFDTEEEGPVYHHVDHEAAGRAALGAARELGSTTLYFIHTSAPDVLVDFEPVATAKQDALTAVWGYHEAGPFGWINRLSSALGIDRHVGGLGGRSSFPEVGVEYGEQLRREVVPPAAGTPDGP
ncbi:MAG: PIG-L family deacetylase [Coriobacteriia bacterium]|nr:PIG-L family deacetylase [Coriobacteriia bacterium]